MTHMCHICEQGFYDDHIMSEKICIAIQSICDKMFICDRGTHLPHEKWEQKWGNLTAAAHGASRMTNAKYTSHII